jgi:hypothetical protein
VSNEKPKGDLQRGFQSFTDDSKVMRVDEFEVLSCATFCFAYLKWSHEKKWAISETRPLLASDVSGNNE